MSVKTTGLEFKKFFTDDDFWPEGWSHEGVIMINRGDCIEFDMDDIKDDAIVCFQHGVVLDEEYASRGSFESFFKKWRRKQTIKSILVECDVAKFEAVKAAIKLAGGRVK